MVASASLPGRPRWTVYDAGADCFYPNITAPSRTVNRVFANVPVGRLLIQGNLA